MGVTVLKKFIGISTSSLILLAAGLCLAINPSAFMNTVCYIAGAVCIAIAAIKFFSAYKKNTYSKQVPGCVVLFVLGAVLIFLQSSMISIFPLIVGVCFLTSGLIKLRGAYAFKSSNPGIFKKLLISSLCGIVFALLIIILSGFIGDIIYRLIGVLLIYNSAENIFDSIVSKQPAKKVSKKDAVEAEAKDAE